MSAAAPARPDLWSRFSRFLGRLLGFLLRLLFVLLLAVGLGAGVYFGLPWVYRALVQPVQAHTSQIQDLYNRVEGVRAGTEQSQAAQNERLTTLETGSDAARLRLDAAESEVTKLQADLAAAAEAREALAAEVTVLQTALAELETSSAAVRAAVNNLQPATDATASEVAGLRHELGLLRLENELLRARVQVVAENLGEARAILTGTVAAMTAFIETPGVFVPSVQATLRVRLVSAAALIEAEPAAALADLDSIWREMDRSLIRPE
jgi:capsule polysaccharide export protein KpsE/RkpR